MSHQICFTKLNRKIKTQEVLTDYMLNIPAVLVDFGVEMLISDLPLSQAGDGTVRPVPGVAVAGFPRQYRYDRRLQQGRSDLHYSYDSHGRLLIYRTRPQSLLPREKQHDISS